MQHFFRITIVALTAIAITATASAQRGPAQRAPTHGDLQYATVNGKPLRLDLYLPDKSEGKLPLVVWVHGGGWAAGDKNGCPARRLVERGYAVASVDYRLTGEAPFPAQIEDCKAAIRWLRANAGKYGIDADHIGAWGSSAGGHLVAMLGTTGQVRTFDVGEHLEVPSGVQAVCDYYGPTDLLQMDAHAIPSARLKHDDANSPEARLLGGPIQQRREQAARANPITYVTAQSAPFLLVHGDQDPVVACHQSQLLYETLDKAGSKAHWHIIQGAGHGQGFGGKDVEEMVNAFFDRYLKNSPGGASPANQITRSKAQKRASSPVQSPSAQLAAEPLARRIHLMRRLFAILVTLAVLNLLPERTFAAAPERPNIIFILADDLGIDGVSCCGADKRKTPHIDQLAASGIRFETCYAAPLCGPSRSVLMTGRYAFRTGGLRNSSWSERGPGPKSANEHPVASVLKQAGYATGQAGKWRQVGETPHEWGFDEYVTDPTAGGWYWKSSYIDNGKTVDTGADVYNPDVIQKFTLDFIRRHKDQPFFFYYSMHLVHKPILHTPDSKDKSDRADQYNENIAYMDKQVGEVVAELQKLGLREKTLVLFSGDNGTFGQYCTPVHGRMVHGSKGSMFEGGSRVPLVASWPAVVSAGKVSQDIVCFADMLTTFAELGGAKLPEGVKYDGQSFAPQLRGEKGTPRQWAFVQLGGFWFVREPGWKMNEQGQLFDMSDAPFGEKLVEPAADTADSKAARARLAAVLKDLAPANGRTEAVAGEGKKKGNREANKERKRAKRSQAASSSEK